MNRKYLLGLSACALMAAGSANAASMWLQVDAVNGAASADPVMAGDILTVGLYGNFDGDGSFTSGGTPELSWDSGMLSLAEPATSSTRDEDSIQYVWSGFVFGADNFANRILTGDYANGNVRLAFGTGQSGWGSDIPAAIELNFGPALATGDIEFVRFTFEVLGAAGEGGTMIDLGGTVGTLNADGTNGPGTSFSGVNVDIASAVVPLPAAAWLMLGGLGALFGFRRNA